MLTEIKLIIFFEFIALFVLLIFNIISYFAKEKFARSNYFIVMGIVLITSLLATFVFAPILIWWMSYLNQ